MSTYTQGRAYLVRLLKSQYSVLGALALWSVTYLATLVAFAIVRDRTFVGSDGPLPADQLQYLAWIRESGDHGLISNQFDLEPSRHVFIQPMFFVSGLAWKLGLDLRLSYLIWKPAIVILLFVGFAAYVRRTIAPNGWSRQAALLTALFFFTPAYFAVRASRLGGSDAAADFGGMAREMHAAGWLWGYLPGAAAIGLMPLFLLGIERLVLLSQSTNTRPRLRHVAAVTSVGLLTSWLHPWQGLILLVVVAGLVVWGRFSRRYCILWVPALGVTLPLAYYLALSKLERAWEIAAKQNEFPHLPLWIIVIGLAPIAPFAIVGAMGPRLHLQDQMLRLWVPASLVVHLFSPAFPLHALSGMSLPLAVLSVQGWRRCNFGRRVGAVAVMIGVVPALVWGLAALNNVANGDAPLDPAALAHSITHDEANAFGYLADSPVPGGVLAPASLGSAVPALSGRRTWVAHSVWTPKFHARNREANALFAGLMSQAEAVRFVRATGARFLLSDCRPRSRLEAIVAPILANVRRFGCISIYELHGG